MHEFSIMSDIMEALKEEAEKHELKSVKQVVLEVGELTFLSHEQLKFCYKVLAEGTIFDGSELILETKPASVKCDPCGYEGETSLSDSPGYHYMLPNFSCPECGKPTEIVSGRECIITRMVADVED
ncbi:MAG: hydrogenase maturation nickel metallochaperone HypA [Thermoplasmata archaeon]|nr:hydrogenase maturation nickel metallochaperone HypA [Thermoplasmata archaeon]